jgi:hypothetical protein
MIAALVRSCYHARALLAQRNVKERELNNLNMAGGEYGSTVSTGGEGSEYGSTVSTGGEYGSTVRDKREVKEVSSLRV